MENANDPVDRFIANLPLGLSEAEKFETVLIYFNRALQSKDTASLHNLRAHLVSTHHDTPEERLILDVIDGLLTLRELGER